MATRTVSPESDIYVGQPLNFEIEPTIDDIAVDSAAVITAILIDNISSKKSTVQITPSITLSYNATTSKWDGTFTEAQIAQLLSTPSDINSSLAYSTVYLEIQVNNEFKVHIEMSVSKGVL